MVRIQPEGAAAPSSGSGDARLSLVSDLAGVAGTPSTATSPHLRSSGGAGVLAGDLEIGFVLINEARYRAMARLFGATREQTNLITAVAALALAEAMRGTLRRWMSGPMTPTMADDMLGVAMLRELLASAAGPTVRETPQLGTLLMLAFAGRALGPTVIRSIRGMRHQSQRLNSGFRHRYGYLVDVGHRRQKRYEAHERSRLAALQSEQVTR